MDESTVAVLFRCLEDGARRRILRLLAEVPLTVGEIAEILDLPQSTTSRHLKVLRDSGLVADRHEGTRVIASLVDPPADDDHALGALLSGWVCRQPLSQPLQARLASALGARQDGAYDRLAQQWDTLRRAHYGTQFHLEALCALLPQHWHVLDVGTGTGYLLPVLARQFARVSAIDPSPAMLALAQQRAHRAGLHNVTFAQGSVEALPVRARTVNLALAMLVLHHCRDLNTALAELGRVLTDEGRLLLVEQKPHADRELQRIMSDPLPGLEPAMLEESLAQAGLRAVQCRPLPYPPADDPAAPRKAAPAIYVMVCEKTPRRRKRAGWRHQTRRRSE